MRGLTGRTRIKQMEFRRLENIDRELTKLKEREAHDRTILKVEELDLSNERDPAGSETVLIGVSILAALAVPHRRRDKAIYCPLYYNTFSAPEN